MSIKITIPNSSSDVLTFGSGNTPTAAQIAGIDSGSSNGQLALYTTASGTSTERVRINASGNVGIGTSSPHASAKLHVFATGDYTDESAPFTLGNSSTNGMRLYAGVNNTNDYAYIGSVKSGTAYKNLVLQPNGGNLLVGTTTNSDYSSTVKFYSVSSTYAGAFKGTGGAAFAPLGIWNTASSGTIYLITFLVGAGSSTGSITSNGTTTSYGTSSDYRLKENIAPMTGALNVVAQLKPCTYNWKINGSNGQGFIAHELEAVVPDAVTGEKDAINEDGSIKPQGIDTSFLVATLTAAIQEQQAIITSLTDRVSALDERLTALENK